MKVTILILALVAIAASVAYAAPEKNEEAELEALLEKLMKQNELQEVDMQEDEDDEDEEKEAALQEFFAREQVPAEVQGWFKKAFRRVKRFVVRKAIPFARRVYGAYKCYRG